jgi:hypothetical protein
MKVALSELNVTESELKLTCILQAPNYRLSVCSGTWDFSKTITCQRVVVLNHTTVTIRAAVVIMITPMLELGLTT